MSHIEVNVDLGVGKPFSAKCLQENKQDLLEAVEVVKKNILEIKKNSSVAGAERIALMAALNIAYEFNNFINKIENKLSESVDC